MILLPTIKIKRVTDIKADLLKSYGITALILDVDNTLSTHHGQILTDGLPEWLEYMKNSGIALMVLSNSKEERVKPFAEKINLNYVALGLKPLPFGYWRALKMLGTEKRSTAIVGDQIFTDVLGGNAVGLKTVLLTPIKPEDGWWFKLRRKAERLIFKLYKVRDIET